MHRAKFSIIALIILAVAVSVMSGCGRKGLINVNGEKVSKDEFYRRLELVTVQSPAGAKPAGQYVIEQIISEKLVEQLAKKKGVEPSEEQIQQKISLIKKQNPAEVKGPQLEELKRRLKIEQSLINVVSKGVEVSDSDVKKAYEQALSAPNSPFKRAEQIRFSAIVCMTKPNIDKAYKLLKEGNDFASVSAQLTEDERIKKSKGAIGWTGKDDATFTAITRKAVWSTPIGKYSAPFKDDTAWIIVKSEQKRPAKTTPFEDVKFLIAENMKIQKGSSDGAYMKELQEFTKAAKVVVNAERYKNIPDALKENTQAALDAMSKGKPMPGDMKPK